jgi:hypothetical protein
LLELHERDRAAGLKDAPCPPVYPKQPDEPPRVAPVGLARVDGNSSRFEHITADGHPLSRSYLSAFLLAVSNHLRAREICLGPCSGEGILARC